MAVGSVGSVAVVGAGIAGLACAAALQAGGARVVVFDKARGPGGRMSTRRLDTDRAQTWDHGAQFFTARDPAFAAQVAAWVTAGVVASWAGRVVRWGHAPEPEASPGERFVGVPGMSGALASLASGLDLRLKTRVEQIERVAQGFRLSDDQGNPLGLFERVALAVPGPQAVPLAQASAGVNAAVASLAYAPCWAVMVAFDTPVAADFDAAFVEERRGSPLGFIARDSTKPGRAPGERWGAARRTRMVCRAPRRHRRSRRPRAPRRSRADHRRGRAERALPERSSLALRAPDVAACGAVRLRRRRASRRVWRRLQRRSRRGRLALRSRARRGHAQRVSVASVARLSATSFASA